MSGKQSKLGFGWKFQSHCCETCQKIIFFTFWAGIISTRSRCDNSNNNHFFLLKKGLTCNSQHHMTKHFFKNSIIIYISLEVFNKWGRSMFYRIINLVWHWQCFYFQELFLVAFCPVDNFTLVSLVDISCLCS